MNNWVGLFFSKEKHLVWILLLMLTGFFLYLALASGGVYGGADTYLHYAISHYAFRYPYLFVDHWGKPLFTALSSPFSQMGFFGLQLFNIILSLLSAYLAYGVCKRLELQYSWLSILLVLFAPVYFILVFTGLTEILFGLVLILGVFLFFREKYWLAAITISFLPFARTEGFVILPLFALAFGYRKKWLPIIFLATGFLFYSLAGYAHYKDFLWFFTKNPYIGAQDIYGKGSLWYFLLSYREIFGIGFTFLILLGIANCFLPFFIKNRNKSYPVVEILLILLPVVIYFAAHSYLWWKGMNGSLGLIRVMAGIIPLAAVLGIKGINLLMPFINKRKKLFIIPGILLLWFIIYEPFSIYTIPFPNGPEELVLDKTAFWIKKENMDQQRTYSGNAYLFFKLNLDVFDEKKGSMNFPPKEELLNWTNPGDLFVWDAHFGPNECRTPMERLMNNKYFLLKAIFLPDESFLTMGGHPYEVYVFQRQIDTVHADNSTILKEILANQFVKRQIYLNTFSTTNIFADNDHSNSCFLMKKDIEYSPGMDTKIKQCNFGNNRNFEMSIDVFPINKGNTATIDFVSSVSSSSKTYVYNTFTIDPCKLEKYKWNTLLYSFSIPKKVSGDAEFKVYLWNNNKTEIYLDNLKVNVIEKK
jgi:hypothetical protein